MDYPRMFRTYSCREEPAATCKIWEAARATTAAPSIFKGIWIAEPGHPKEFFIDGGLRCNNPVKELLSEAKSLFGADAPLGVIVSIGTGHPGPIGLPPPKGFQKVLPTKLVDVLVNLATNAERASEDLSRQFANAPNIYFRYNVRHGAGNVSLDAWERLGDVKGYTKSYLSISDVSSSVDTLVGQIGGFAIHEALSLSSTGRFPINSS